MLFLFHHNKRTLKGKKKKKVEPTLRLFFNWALKIQHSLVCSDHVTSQYRVSSQGTMLVTVLCWSWLSSCTFSSFSICSLWCLCYFKYFEETWAFLLSLGKYQSFGCQAAIRAVRWYLPRGLLCRIAWTGLLSFPC